MSAKSKSHRAIDLNDEITKENVGLNIFALSEVSGKSIDSIATLSDIPRIVFVQWKQAEGTVGQSRLDAVANVFDIESDALCEDFDSEFERKQFWTQQLEASGLITSDDDEDTADQNNDSETNTIIGFQTAINAQNDAGGDNSPAATNDAGLQKPTLDDDPPTEDLLAEEPVWSDDDMVVSLGSKQFPLKDKQFRAALGANIRALLKREDGKIVDLVNIGALKTSGVLRGVELGRSLLQRSSIEAIAGLYSSSSVQELVTGVGLEEYQTARLVVSKAGSGGKIGGSITIPTMSEREFQDYFMNLMTSDKIQFLAGNNPLSILKQVTENGADSIVWSTDWFEKTDQGEKIRGFIEKNVKQLRGLAEPLRIMILMKIVELVWSEDHSDGVK